MRLTSDHSYSVITHKARTKQNQREITKVKSKEFVVCHTAIENIRPLKLSWTWEKTVISQVIRCWSHDQNEDEMIFFFQRYATIVSQYCCRVKCFAWPAQNSCRKRKWTEKKVEDKKRNQYSFSLILSLALDVLLPRSMVFSFGICFANNSKMRRIIVLNSRDKCRSD